MDRVHEGVYGPGPQGWSMDLGSMFCIHPVHWRFTYKILCYSKMIEISLPLNIILGIHVRLVLVKACAVSTVNLHL